jgi:small conductance mechanosensitive channel
VLQDPVPILQAGHLGDWAVSLAVKPWVAVPDFGPATGEINREVLAALRQRHIEIPFPQREVRLIGAPAH